MKIERTLRSPLKRDAIRSSVYSLLVILGVIGLLMWPPTWSLLQTRSTSLGGLLFVVGMYVWLFVTWRSAMMFVRYKDRVRLIQGMEYNNRLPRGELNEFYRDMLHPPGFWERLGRFGRVARAYLAMVLRYNSAPSEENRDLIAIGKSPLPFTFQFLASLSCELILYYVFFFVSFDSPIAAIRSLGAPAVVLLFFLAVRGVLGVPFQIHPIFMFWVYWWNGKKDD